MSSRNSDGSLATLPIQAVTSAIDVGTLLGGRYRVTRWLGRGGMGSVFEVEDTALGATVALKVAEGDAWEPGTVAQLKREIMLARRVTHPNVCRVHDFGLHVGPSGAAVPFLTMELLRGEPLSTLLVREGAFGPERVLELLDAMAAALDAAHAAGVLHRDFKTGNVMLAEGRTVVTDFGLALDTANASGATGSIVGSPAYMSPEQVRDAPLTRASDVYALGIVLYELLSGRLPFDGGSSLEIATRRLVSPPTPLSVHVPNLDSRWERVLERCLRVEPSERYASCGDVARALRGERPGAESRPPAVSTAHEPGSRAVAIVVAEGVREQRFVERAAVRHAGVWLAPQGDRMIAVFGAQRSLGDELDRALSVARAAAKVSLRVALGVGRATLRDGVLEGDVLDEALDVLTLGARGLVAGHRSALALATRTELTPLGTGTNGAQRIGASRRTSAPLVGRDAELALLRRTRDAVLDEQRLLATWIVGPPGVGKSRLVEAAAALAAERAMVTHLARGSLRDAAFGLFPGAPAAPDVADARDTPVTQSVVLRDDPQALADRVRAQVVTQLERLSAAGPIALVLDQVQWADVASLELLEELPALLPDRAVWVVLAAREDIAEVRPGLLAALDVGSRLEPSMLRAVDVAELARLKLGATPPGHFVTALLERTQGHPLYVEQLLAVLPRADADLEREPLPATVELAVQARLDRLPEAERACLQALSVCARSVRADDLSALGVEDADALLASLSRRSLVVRSAALGGTYRLRNALLGDVAYRMLDDARRRALHTDAARVAEASGWPAEDVARHLAEAGEKPRAAALFARAAIQAAARGDGRAVLRNGARAIELGLPRDEAFAVQLARADAARFIGDPSTQKLLLDDALVRAETDRERALVRVEQGEWLRRNRRLEEALDVLGEGTHLARRSGDADTVALATARRASALVTLGRVEEADAALLELEPSLPGCSARTRAVAHDVHGYLASQTGDIGAQRAAYAAAATLYTEAGDVRRAAGAESNLADVENRLGRFDEAEAGFRRALELARRVGNRLTEGYARLNLGFALTELGLTSEALTALDAAAELARALGDAHLALGARLYAARATVLHAPSTALLELCAAIAADAHGDPTIEAHAHLLAARTALALHDPATAASAADRALALRAARGAIEEGEGELFHFAALAFEAAGRPVDAAAARATGRARVLELAARIADPNARQSFLERIPAHHALATPDTPPR